MSNCSLCLAEYVDMVFCDGWDDFVLIQACWLQFSNYKYCITYECEEFNECLSNLCFEDHISLRLSCS